MAHLSLEARLAASPPLISIEEFLKLSQIGKTTFYRHVTIGNLKTVKRGRFTFIPREEAQRFLTSGVSLP